MICPNCGSNNPSDSSYCGACGSSLAPTRDAAAQSRAPATPPPAELAVKPASALASEDVPTIRPMHTVAEPENSVVAVDEEPTMRVLPPRPASAPSEFVNIAPAAAQEAAQPLPTPASAYQAPVSSPTPAPTLGISGAGYPPVQVPSSGAGDIAPIAVPAPSPVSGAQYPPQTPLMAYPPQTPLPGFSSGAYPGQPSGVFPTATNEFPAGVYPSPVPGSFPGQPGPAGWGNYATPGVPPAPQPSTPSKLINPLPRWAFIASIVIVAVLLGALTFFAGPDWAAGGRIAGVVALVAATLLLIAFSGRAALGMLVPANPHRRAQVISSLLLILLLIAFGAVGLTQQTGLHVVQAHALEAQQNWQQAVNEYLAAGQGGPNSEDIARTYNEWGESLLNNGQHYADAIAKFEIVTTNYPQALTGYAQAKKDATSAYQKWGQQATQNQQYDQATQHYDKLLAQQYCDSACQTQISALDATAYFKLAEQKLAQQPPDYAAAVAAFNRLTTHFSSSPESQSAHADYAKALLGDGQQLVNTTCSSALSLYQQLASQFSDTPQGQQAATALKQPVAVKGHFTMTIPSGADVPVVGLVQGITANISSTQFYAILAKSPLAPVAGDGTFVFNSIKQGSYYLVWGTQNQSANRQIFSVSQLYPAAVGQLCAFNFGDINEKFPIA